MLHVILRPPFDELQPYKVHDHVFGDTETVKPKCVCAHFEIGDSTKEINLDLVESVLAEDFELRHIFTYFSGLPMRFIENDLRTLAPQQQWFGDDAKFIVANWT